MKPGDKVYHVGTREQGVIKRTMRGPVSGTAYLVDFGHGSEQACDSYELSLGKPPQFQIGEIVEVGPEEGIDVPDWALGQKGMVTGIIPMNGTFLYVVVLASSGLTWIDEAYHFDKKD